MADLSQEESELAIIRRRFKSMGEIVSKLGQGAMGAVYKVRRNGEELALKVLLPKVLEDEQQARRFQLEGEILTSFDHPNILKVYDVGTLERWPYMLCELVDGGSVDSLVGEKAVAWQHALMICESVLEALVLVHGRKIYHRDIKLSNLRLTKNGTVKLADFGIAKAQGMDTKKTTTGIIVGTPAYIAPEVLKGRPADARSDLYSLGIVLYELLTGELPWDFDDATDYLTARLTAAAPRLWPRHQNVPRSIDSLVQSALATEPVERFPSASTFLLALRNTRDRLIQNHGNDQTVRIDSLVEGETAQARSDRGRPAPEMMRTTNRRPPRLARVDREEDQHGLKVAALLVALGIALIGGIAFTRSNVIIVRDDDAATGNPEAAAELTDSENRQVNDLTNGMVGSSEFSLLDQKLAEYAKMRRGGPILYNIWKSSPEGSGKRHAALALVNNGHVLCVPALISILVEKPDPTDTARVDAAGVLMKIIEEHKREEVPDAKVCAQKLGSVLVSTKAYSRNERREVVLAAIRGLGWFHRKDTSKVTLNAMTMAPGNVGWFSGEFGQDPDKEVDLALEKIGSADAKELLKLRSGSGKRK